MPSEAYGFDENKMRVAISDAVMAAVGDLDSKINARMNQIYPVDSIYITLKPDNPATYLGFGEWQPFGQGKVLVGVDSFDPDFTIGKSGGHKATEKHSHKFASKFWLRCSVTPGGTVIEDVWGGSNFSYENKSYPNVSYHGELKSSASYAKNATYITIGGDTGTAGSGNAGNLQPYTTAYFWRRTA